MDLRANAIITAVDRFSGPMARMSAAMNGLVGRSASVAAAGRRMGSAMTGPGSLGASMAGGMFLATQLKFEEAMNRTQAVLDIEPTERIKPLRDEILRLAEAYPAMRTEIAKATTELAQSGMKMETVQAVLEQTIKGAMASGESIANVGMGVTDVVMGMGLPFKTAAEQMKTFARANDVMAAGATLWNQNYMQFLSGLTRGGPIAAAAKLSLEQLSVMLGLLANAGFKAERGGVAISSSLMRIAAPTKQAREAVRALGVDLDKFVKASPEFRNIGADGLVANLEEEMGQEGALGDQLRGTIESLLKNPSLTADRSKLGLALNETIIGALGIDKSSTQDREKVAQTVQRFLSSAFSQVDVIGALREMAAKGGHENIAFVSQFFGKHHGGKMAALMRAIFQGYYDEGLKALEGKAPGATDRFANIMMQGFVGAWHRMTSQFDALLERLAASGVLDTVTEAFKKVTDAVNRLGQSDPTLLKWITTAGLVVGVLGPIGFALGGLATGISAIAAAMALPGVMPLLAAGGIAALLGGGAVFQGKWENNLDGLEPYQTTAPIAETWSRVKEIFTEIAGLVSDTMASLANLGGEIQRLLGIDASESVFVRGLKSINESLKSTAESVRAVRENIDAIKAGNFGDVNWRSFVPRNPLFDLGRRAMEAVTPPKSELAPLATHPIQMIQDMRNWAPTKVEGSATIKVEPIRVEVTGPGRALNPDQQPAEQSVPLRTGQGLGDIGAP